MFGKKKFSHELIMCFSILVSATVSLFCMYAMLYHMFLEKPISQIARIGVGILIFFLVLFCFSFCLRYYCTRKDNNAMQIEKNISHSYVIIGTAIGIAIAFHRFLTEPQHIWGIAQLSELLPYKCSPFVFFSLAITLSSFIISSLLSERGAKRNLRNIPTMCFLATMLFLYAAMIYQPDPFVSDAFHMTAYTQTIYNVFFWEPYTLLSTGVYGHYGLLFLLPVKVLGCTSKVIAVLVTGAGCLHYLCICYAVWRLTKNNAIRCMTAFVLVSVTLAFRDTAYWQLQPHRMVFPAIMLAYIVHCCGKDDPISARTQVIGYIICGLAVIWNTETGIFLSLAYAVYVTLMKWWQQDRRVNGSVIRTALWQMAGIVAAVSLMIFAVNIYNLIVGGPFVLKECFFPIVGGNLGDTSYVGALTEPLDFHNISWIHVLLLFMVSFGVGFCEMLQQHTQKPCWQAVLVFSALLGMLQMTYYYNRTAYLNLEIILPIASLCMAVLAQKGFDVLRNQKRPFWFKGLACSYAVTIIFSMAVQIVFCGFMMPDVFIWKTVTSGRSSTERITRVAAQLAEEIPENTYAYGYCAADAYAVLGWDPQYHLRDASDMFGEEVQLIEQEIFSQPALLINTANIKQLKLTENHPEYVKQSEIEYFTYYVRRSQ